MKNLQFQILLLLFATTALMQAQPTITSATAGGPGDEFTNKMIDAILFDPGASGADVTWDFSGVTLTGETNDYAFITAAATGQSAAFPDANVAADNGMGNYSFYKINASVYENHGIYTPDVTVLYSDPEELMTFPITYNATNSDDFYSTIDAGVEIIRSGTVETVADGYGTLKLPDGTYTDVMRVFVHEVYSDVTVGVPVDIDYDMYIWFWLKEGVVGPLFTYYFSSVSTGGFPTISQVAMINESNSTVGIKDQTAQTTLKAFPNPANDMVHVSGVSASAKKIILTDLLGNNVSEIENPTISEGMISFSSATIPSGMYIAQVVDENSVQSVNIQILH